MSTQPQTAEYILEQLTPLPVRVREMFGEYALYCDDKLPGFICDDTLFIKILPENTSLATGLETGPCYPGSKDYYIVPVDKLEEHEWLKDFVTMTANNLPAKRKK